MRAIVYEKPLAFEIREVFTPEPGPGYVRLRNTITGVCGTDLHIYDGGFLTAYPLTPGHEIVGVVDKIGDGVEGLTVGQQVVADNTQLCGHCYYCKRNMPLFCQNFYSRGCNGPGGFAEFVVVPGEKCFPADDLAPEVAVMTEPTACAVHGMDVLGLQPGSDVLLFGAGPTGLVLAQLVMHGGAARVTVAAPTAFKLELARSYGIDRTVQIDRTSPGDAVQHLRDLAPLGYDVVIEAAGSPALQERSTSLVRDGGTVMIYGMAPEEARVPFSPYEIFRRELTIKGSFAQTHCFDRSLAVLRSGRVRTEGMVNRRYGLDDFGEALHAVAEDKTCLKAVIVQG